MTKPKWNTKNVTALFEQPFFQLVNQAYRCHQENNNSGDFDLCILSNIKTGACPENCGYCNQSAHFNTGLKKEKMRDVDSVIEEAKRAKANGAKRFCMGAAWRSPPEKDFPKVLAMVKAVKSLGLEACVTLGMINSEHTKALKQAGLDYYNHNLDTSEEFYSKIVSTRSYQDRLATLTEVAKADINVCCGGILGMGEDRKDRISFLLTLTTLLVPPGSIPINQLIPIPGTPLAKQKGVDPFEYIRTIAVTRIMFPTAKIRLSAGREKMSDIMQAWCFMAGANSIFIGEKLLTADNNPDTQKDLDLLKRLDINVEPLSVD